MQPAMKESRPDQDPANLLDPLTVAVFVPATLMRWAAALLRIAVSP